MSATQTIPPPGIVVRGRSFLALTLAPEWPLRAWLAGLDAQRLRAASLFEGRPLVVNLAGAPGGPAEPEAALEALDALALRDLRVIGVDGVDADLLNGTRWGRLPTALLGKAAYGFPWYDAHLWAYAEHYGLPELLSEDFEHGRRYGTVRVRNPFLDAGLG